MYVNFLSTYSDKKSCHTSTTLQTSIARSVSDSWASFQLNYSIGLDFTTFSDTARTSLPMLAYIHATDTLNLCRLQCFNDFSLRQELITCHHTEWLCPIVIVRWRVAATNFQKFTRTSKPLLHPDHSYFQFAPTSRRNILYGVNILYPIAIWWSLSNKTLMFCPYSLWIKSVQWSLWGLPPKWSITQTRTWVHFY